MQLTINLLFWIGGMGILFLWLKNANTKVVFSNIDTAFFLGGAIGLAAAFIGEKANLVSWMTWVAYAAGGAYVTSRLLQRKKDNQLVVKGVYGSVSPGNKDEKTAWVVVRSIITLCALLFFFYGFIFPQPCDLDKNVLWCRLTWSALDVVGVIGFAFGLTVITGINQGFKNFMNPEGSSLWNLVAFGELAVSIGLIWWN